MLYEINTLPWKYQSDHQPSPKTSFPTFAAASPSMERVVLWGIVLGLVGALVSLFVSRERRRAKYASYEPVKEAEMEP